MALLNTYTDANLVVEQGLTITYSVSKVFGNWVQTAAFDASVYVYDTAWEVRRIAKGVFKYVGLNYATAKTCANDMISQYTRSTRVSKWAPPSSASLGNAEFVDQDGGNVPMADVSIQHVDGHMYEVIVSVSESDTRMRINRPASAESLFSTENQRTYPQF